MLIIYNSIIKTGGGSMKKKTIFISLIIIIAIALNFIYGNPVSARLAQSSVEKHLAENHPEYEIKRQWYDWLNGQYCAEVWIPDSEDCIFDMTLNHFGYIRHSGYEYTVANNFNTFLRADRMYSQMCDPIIDKFTHESERPEGIAHTGSFGVGSILDIGEERLMNPPFENDKEYTREEINALGEIYGEIFIYLRELPESDITVENLADTILQAKNEFDANNIKFNKITVQLSGDKSGIYWMYIPYEIINESDILQLTTENSTYDQYYD